MDINVVEPPKKTLASHSENTGNAYSIGIYTTR